ncbi:MAG: helix-turn-helix domain-containing protein [Clostridia bacterium]|nr:helix-turn-helix domain-containing protein [Clostridia bacterium]
MLGQWPPMYIDSGQEIVVVHHKTNYGMNVHTHEYFEIEYVILGSCHHRVENESFELSRGDIALFKVNSRHEFYTSGEVEIVRIKIRSEFLPEIYTAHEDEFTLSNFLHLPPNEVKRVEDIILMIEKELKERNQYAAEVITGYLEVLFALFIRFHHASHQENKQESVLDFQMILAYIEKNLSTVTPSSVAAYAGYNFPYFSKLFKKYIGKKLSEYINMKKLEAAAKLLTESNKSVENIGYEAGFNHKSYFHRIFKRYYGVTPDEYRKSGTKG